ncbi:Fic family protein [Candidatus Microgenomates bacterium]|nr:Fic family protein [Candidatus Microgenomates bacterium]
MVKNRFEKRIKLSQEVLTKIAKIDQFNGLWIGKSRFSPQIMARLKSWVIITSTGASTRIEGSKMSDEEISRFLRGLKTNSPKNRDEQEVAGYADLLGRIFENWKDLKLSENWILQFHNILLNFSEKDKNHKGKYKVSDNTVVMFDENGKQVTLFKPTSSYLVKPEMQDVIEWTNKQFTDKKLHPLLIIANFIFEFLAIHPFKDGNGRMSRALTNLLLLKSGYGYIPYVSLDEIIEESKTDYYLSLRSTQKNHKTKNEDIAPWLTYFLGALGEQAERAEGLMKNDQPEKLLSEKQVEIYNLFDNNDELTVAKINKFLKNKFPLVTIKQVLSRLVYQKLIERIGQGRGTRYIKLTP